MLGKRKKTHLYDSSARCESTNFRKSDGCWGFVEDTFSTAGVGMVAVTLTTATSGNGEDLSMARLSVERRVIVGEVVAGE